jgi:hypothetical protein
VGWTAVPEWGNGQRLLSASSMESEGEIDWVALRELLAAAKIVIPRLTGSP